MPPLQTIKFRQPHKDEAKITGTSDVSLDTKGKDQSEDIGVHLKTGGGLDRLYYSKARRAIETADIVKKHLPNLKAIATTGLYPWHLGKLEGQPESDTISDQVKLIHNPDTKAEGQGPKSTNPGESFNSFTGRFKSFTSRLMQQHKSDQSARIGAVTHSRNLQVLNSWAKHNFKPDYTPTVKDMFAEVSKPGSIQRVWHDGSKWQMQQHQSGDKNKPGIYFIRHGKTEWD